MNAALNATTLRSFARRCTQTCEGSQKVWISDVIDLIKAETGVPRLTIRCALVDANMAGELSLSRCDMPAEFGEIYGADRVARSETRSGTDNELDAWHFVWLV